MNIQRFARIAGAVGVLMLVPGVGSAHADVVASTLVGEQQCDAQTHEVVVRWTLTNHENADFLIDGYLNDVTGLTAGSLVAGNPNMDLETVPPAGTSVGETRLSTDAAGTYRMTLILVPTGNLVGTIVVEPDAVFCGAPTSDPMPSGLPPTGAYNGTLLVTVALGLLGVGGAMLVVRRRFAA